MNVEYYVSNELSIGKRNRGNGV